MNAAPLIEFSRLPPAQDLRPHYEAAIFAFIRAGWRRKWLIAAIMAAAIAAGFAIASVIEKTYVGEALVQLTFATDGTPLVTGANVGGGVSLDPAAILEGEAAVIRSPTIARRVAFQLAKAGKSGRDDKDVPVPPSRGTDTSAEKPAIWALVSSLAANTRQKLTGHSIPSFDHEVLDLQNHLEVRNDGKSYLLRVSYRASDPVRAAATANAFVDAYLQSRLDVSADTARRTSDWLASQILAAKENVALTEQRARAARNGDAATSYADGAPTADKEVADLVSQLSNVRLDRLNLEARLQRLRQAASLGRTPSATDIAGSTDAPRLIEAELASRQDASRLASLLGSKHPLFMRANTLHENARNQLTNAVDSAIGISEAEATGLRSSERSLSDRLQDAKQRAFETQTALKQMRQFDAEAETARSGLERLEESYRQALALADLKSIGAKMVSPAETLSVPASPRLSVILALAIIGGGAASFLVVVLLEMRDTGFRSADRLAADLGARCMGIVPKAGSFRDLSDDDCRREALRALAITAGLTRHRCGNAIVAVTSAVPEEGKRDLVQGLARTLIGLGRRVLVVEGVAGRPGAYQWRDAGSAGAGGRKGVAPAARLGADDRDIAGCFPSASDLRDVFDSLETSQSWQTRSGTRFDVLLLEAPPVLTDADSIIFAQMADLVLFAAKWNGTPRSAVAAAYGQLSQQTSKAAVVLNDVDPVRHKAFGMKDSFYFRHRHLGHRAGRAAHAA